jgi:hypothetical protein
MTLNDQSKKPTDADKVEPMVQPATDAPVGKTAPAPTEPAAAAKL